MVPFTSRGKKPGNSPQGSNESRGHCLGACATMHEHEWKLRAVSITACGSCTVAAQHGHVCYFLPAQPHAAEASPSLDHTCTRGHCCKHCYASTPLHYCKLPRPPACAPTLRCACDPMCHGKLHAAKTSLRNTFWPQPHCWSSRRRLHNRKHLLDLVIQNEHNGATSATDDVGARTLHRSALHTVEQAPRNKKCLWCANSTGRVACQQQRSRVFKNTTQNERPCRDEAKQSNRIRSNGVVSSASRANVPAHRRLASQVPVFTQPPAPS